MVIIFQEVKSEATPDHGEGLQPIEEKVGRKKSVKDRFKTPIED